MALQISIWSDIACPWCYVGKRRLEAALRLVAEELGRAPEITIEYKAFELDPTHQRGAVTDYLGRLAQKFKMPAERVQLMLNQMVATGREEGIAFNFSQAIPANSFNAHRLLCLARSLDEQGKSTGQQALLKDRLFRAHFEEGADVGSAQTLSSLAQSVGLDPDRVSALLASDEFATEVREDEDEAKAIGIRGVPFFAIGPFGVSGAERPNTLAKVIVKALAEADPTKHSSPS